MKLVLKCAVFALGLSSAVLVHAQPAGWQGLYAGATVSRIAYKEEGFSTAYPVAIGGKFGKQFNPNFAIEGRIGFGVSDDEVDVGGLPVKLEIDNYYGVYLKGMLPVSTAASLYGLLGYTRAKLTASAAGFSSSDSESDISFGAGAEFAVSQTAAISVEWARLLKGDGYKVDGLTLGVNFKF